jgi:hypothetical protein
MDDKEFDKRMKEFITTVENRNYAGRRMHIKIESYALDSGESGYRVTGELMLAASETPDDENSWVEKDFSLMIIDKRAEDAIASILMHMNSIPMEFGDLIFEEGFEEFITEAQGQEVKS